MLLLVRQLVRPPNISVVSAKSMAVNALLNPKVSASVTVLLDDAGRVMIAGGGAVNFVKAKTVMKLANRQKRDKGEHGDKSLLI